MSTAWIVPTAQEIRAKLGAAVAQPEERYEYSCTDCRRRLRPSETWRSRPDANGAQTHNCRDHRRPLATLVRQPDAPLVWS